MSEEIEIPTPTPGTLADLLEDPRFNGLLQMLGNKLLVELIIAGSRDTKLRKASAKLILGTWWLYITDLMYKITVALMNGDNEKANLLSEHLYDFMLLRLDNEIRSIDGYTYDGLRTIVNVTETRQQFVRPGVEAVGGGRGLLGRFLDFLRGRGRGQEIPATGGGGEEE